MHPQEQFCQNNDCPARGQIGKGNIRIHSRKDERYQCNVCKCTFTKTKGSLLYGLKKDQAEVIKVITLLAYGCPIPAIVAAFGLDVRTIRSWLLKAGQHCRGVHKHFLAQKALDLQQVQADEIKVKTQSGSVWMALAMMVSTRLWLAGAVSPKRDKVLIRDLAAQIRSVALCRNLLLAVDGLKSYVQAFQKAFRTPLPTGKCGRPKMIAWQSILIVQVIKQKRDRHFSIQRRIVQGSERIVEQILQITQGGGVINTAYIERLNATFRQRLAVLARRTRNLARKPETLQASMYLLGCVYNFCAFHKSLRLPLYVGERGRKWVKRTPALAVGWADHRWSMMELLCFKVPPTPWQPPRRRGRPSKEMIRLVNQWCS
jgi:transposase-like protein